MKQISISEMRNSNGATPSLWVLAVTAAVNLDDRYSVKGVTRQTITGDFSNDTHRKTIKRTANSCSIKQYNSEE